MNSPFQSDGNEPCSYLDCASLSASPVTEFVSAGATTAFGLFVDDVCDAGLVLVGLGNRLSASLLDSEITQFVGDVCALTYSMRLVVSAIAMVRIAVIPIRLMLWRSFLLLHLGVLGWIAGKEADGAGKALQIESFLDSKKLRHLGRLLAHFRRCIERILDCSIGIVKPFQKELCIRQSM